MENFSRSERNSHLFEKLIEESNVELHKLSAFTRAIINDYHSYAHLIRENANIAKLFYILCTKEARKENKLHCAINNLSGAGKTTLAEGVIKPFRLADPESIIDVVRFTGPALERFEQGFDHKILFLSQALGNESTSVRPLLSEGKLGLLVTEKNPKNGKFESTRIEVPGMPVFLSTMTHESEPETMRRLVEITVDESEEQTQLVLAEQARQAAEIEKTNLNAFAFVRKVIERLKSPGEVASLSSSIEDVKIPFAQDLLEKMPRDLEMRSRFPQFLKLIKSIALVKAACFRGFLKYNPGRIIALAECEDFQDALFMVGSSFFQPVSAFEAAVLNYLKNQVEREKTETFAKVRKKVVQRALGKSEATIRHAAARLADLNLIDITYESDAKNAPAFYQYLKDQLVVSGFQIDEAASKQLFETRENYEHIEIEDKILPEEGQNKHLSQARLLPSNQARRELAVSLHSVEEDDSKSKAEPTCVKCGGRIETLPLVQEGKAMHAGCG